MRCTSGGAWPIPAPRTRISHSLSSMARRAPPEVGGARLERVQGLGERRRLARWPKPRSMPLHQQRRMLQVQLDERVEKRGPRKGGDVAQHAGVDQRRSRRLVPLRASCALRCARPAPEQCCQLRLSERLAQEIVHAGGQAAFAVSFHGIGGERDDGHPRRPAPASRRRISAVAVSPSMTRHLTIHEHRIEARIAHRFDRQPAIDRPPRSCSRDSRACRSRPRDSPDCPRPAESAAALHRATARRAVRSSADGPVPVGGVGGVGRDDEVGGRVELLRLICNGFEANLEPKGRSAVLAWLRTPMSPPISVTSCRQIARPRPVPPYLRVVKESA